MNLLIGFSLCLGLAFCAPPKRSFYSVNVGVRDLNSQNKFVRNPEAVKLEITADKRYILNLKRNDNLNHDAPVHTIGTREADTSKNSDISVYHDKRNNAAIGIKSELDQDGIYRRSVTGIFSPDNDGTEFYISPTSEVKRDSMPGGHTMQKREVFLNDDANIKRVISKKWIKAQREAGKTGKRFIKRSKQRLDIEILAVVDYGLYKHWLDMNNNDATKALTKLKEYYAYYFNGIDLRYGNIEDATYSYNTRLVGYVIAKQPSDSPWTENIKQSTSTRYQCDAETALAAFKSWNEQDGKNYATHDHAMLLTNYDLTAIIKNELSNSVAGLAYVGVVCTTSATSICETFGGLWGVGTAAHELAHSMGAEHDGHNNSCDPNLNHIMTPSSGLTTSAQSKNPFTFSQCSINYMNTYVNSLGSNNCLLDLGDTIAVLNPKKPGQLYDVNQQCKQIFGPSSGFCADVMAEDFCRKMYCKKETSCITNFMQPARGTSCGNHKWCIDGSCVYDSNAPEMDEKCPLGDQPGYLSWLGNTCVDAIAGYPYYCEQTSPKLHCCATCAKYYTGIAGCEYGDRVAGCTTSVCYGENNLRVCCKTCHNVKK